MKEPPRRRLPRNQNQHQQTPESLIAESEARVQHRRAKILPELARRLRLYRDAIEYWLANEVEQPPPHPGQFFLHLPPLTDAEIERIRHAQK